MREHARDPRSWNALRMRRKIASAILGTAVAVSFFSRCRAFFPALVLCLLTAHAPACFAAEAVLQGQIGPEDRAAFAQEAQEFMADDEEYLDAQTILIADPIEGWNRAVFSFNDVAMAYVLRPISKGYVYITPKPVRSGLRNFFHNWLFPVRFVNNLLQGKGMAAGVEMSRFVLNTTAGLGGLFDVAKNKKTVVPVDEEDLGQTFGVWGIGDGFYIVWPLIGPSTARDSLGMVGDYFLDPLVYMRPWELRLGLSAGRAFNDLDSMLDLYDDMRRMSVEPYTSVRSSYVQYRRAKVAK